MKIYNYTAVRADNSYAKGEIKAYSQRRALAALERDGLLVVNIKRTVVDGWRQFAVFATVSRLDKIHLTRHLHAFLDAGIPLDRSLQIAIEQTDNRKLKDILTDVYHKVVKGQALYASLGAHNKYFSSYFINMTRVGEESGTLDLILKHLLEQQEKEYELLSKVRGALVYPSLIIVVAILILSFMMAFVIPTVASVLREYGGELPLATRIIIAVSDFFVNYGWTLILLVPVLVLLFRRLIGTKRGQRVFEKIIFRLPGTRKIVLSYNLARFTRSMSAPLQSGLAIDKSLELASKTMSNSHYREAITHGIVVVRKGIPLSEVLLGYPQLFPPNVTRMVEVGEKTGRVDQMFLRLADFHEKSLFHTFGNLSSVIEPFLLVAIGLAVGFIAVSVLTPIWKFAEAV